MVKNGWIDNDGVSWMETTVTASAGDKVSFYWKVSSQEDHDYLKFYIDNDPQDSISGDVDWQKKSYNLSAGTRTLKWEYSKDSSGSDGDDRGWVDGLVVGTEKLYPVPDEISEALDSNLKFTKSGDGGWWWITSGSGTDEEYYYDADALCIGAETGGDEACLQAIVDSDSSETIKFHWKISGQSGSDYLRFYIDGALQNSITGEQDWQPDPEEFTVSAGIHTLKWGFSQGGSSGDHAWLDFVQWSGPSAAQDPANFQTINYKHDVYGQRIEKKVDGYSTRYLYDGPQVIAEYDGNNNLLRKYIYGPGIDQPVCMMEENDQYSPYYYHYDGLGSVVALSDSSGDTVQTYEYSVYGQVAVEDVNNANPYMFAGCRYDIEIGLYYNRARYYNPFVGRFLQTDPIGYEGGMNMYAYCGNNAINLVDPMGLDHSDYVDDPPEFGKGDYQNGLFYFATGRMLVLPAVWVPSTLTNLEEMWDNVENMHNLGNLVTIANIAAAAIIENGVGVGMNLTELVYNNTAATTMLGIIGNLLSKIAMHSLDGYGYSPFFEVCIQDADTGEELGRRWMGVRGIKNNGILKEQFGDHVYDTYEDAFIAAAAGASTFSNWLLNSNWSEGDQGEYMYGSDVFYGWFEYTGDAMSDEDGTWIPFD
jgi:RHS repeat-associated protein